MHYKYFDLWKKFLILYILVDSIPIKKTPCDPSPCGPNSICKEVGETPSCECMNDFMGRPPYCRPECVTNSECDLDKSCINRKCINPCIGACGSNTNCRVISHSPMCSCQSGYEGDAFDQCHPRKGTGYFYSKFKNKIGYK